ncbi:septation protein A [Sandaracinobacter neustonicus]|uniref:septation protein A n=1 Tax=Sandaracinobacter neustonicus TaxID=1715348 RepID=UPI001F3E5F96|nr:septation protein A [Sandaracinobacter neustonicus]
MTEQPVVKPARRELDGWKKLSVDLGPLLVFFAVYSRFDVFVGTAAFMVATAIAMGISWALTRHIAAMTWFSAVLVGVFGGLTLWLHDETFIKMKPTIVFLTLSGVLTFGLLRGRNYLKTVVGSAFNGLSDEGWTLLTRRWALFFLLLGLTNELLWRAFPTNIWLHFKIWGDSLLTFLFMGAQVPMMLKHGLNLEDPKEADPKDESPPKA